VQITHFCNSCISVEAGNTRLLCDPWIGPADTNAWLSFPFKDEGPRILVQLNPNYIYISHLHPDHHDTKTLEHLARDTAILMKKFPDKRLLGKLAAQGFNNIVELDAWTPLTLDNDLEVTIVPSTSMVNQEIEAVISYDIDTSLIVRCLKTGQVFYNNVDNPTSLSALKEIRAFSEKNWNKPIDIACLPVGAASEYPHCFINIDRNAAARRIINNALNELPERIDALGCTSFFAAGGTYVIRGKFSALNQYIAQPSFEELKSYLTPWTSAGNKIFQLEGGFGIAFHKDTASWQPCDTGLEKTSSKHDYAIAAHQMPYDYSDASGRTSEFTKRLQTAFPGAKSNYDSVMKRIGLVQNWTTELNLYENIQIDKNGDIINSSKVIEQITIPSAVAQTSQTLVFHMDIGLFVDLIEGKGNWNGALSGTYILYERIPDIFLPDIPFSLNFLVNRELERKSF